MTASFMARNVSSRFRTLKRYSYGSSTRYWTIHSSTATLRSPVNITDSSPICCCCPAYWVRMPASTVRKPNSCLSCRCTGTRCITSTNGILKCRPGSVVREYFPKRSTTPPSSGSTWKAVPAAATSATIATTPMAALRQGILGTLN